MRAVPLSRLSVSLPVCLLAVGLAAASCSKEEPPAPVDTPATGGRAGSGGRGGASGRGGSGGSGPVTGSGGSGPSSGSGGSISVGTGGAGGGAGSGGSAAVDASDETSSPIDDAAVGETGSAPDAGESEVPAGPPACASTVKAVGDGPIIDDFEDGDSTVLNRDGRVGTWFLAIAPSAMVTDFPMGSGPIKPVTGGNPGRALHVKGTESDPTKWGVSLAADLAAPGGCYDVSVYKSIRLQVKGKVGSKILLLVFTGRTRPGDTAIAGPYIRSIELKSATAWQTETVAFDALQNGWGSPPPFSPAEVYAVGIAPVIGAGQTEFDFWVDNVTLVK